MDNIITNTFIKSNPSDVRMIHKYLATVCGYELSQISEPCYFPKIVKYKNDFFSKTKIDPKNTKLFLKQMNPTYANFAIFNDELTVGLIAGLLHFSRSKDYDVAKICYFLLAIKFYSSLVNISFPRFCDRELWIHAFTQVSPKHLIREKGGMSGAIMHIVNSLYKIYFSKLEYPYITDNDLIRVVYDLRHRLSQSIKSFAEIYYHLQKTGDKSVGGSAEKSVTTKDDVITIADKISMSMCTFEQIDDKLLKLAIYRSGIQTHIGHSIIEELSNVEFKDKIRFIIILLGKGTVMSALCKETGRTTLIRKIEKNIKIGDYTIKDEMLKLMHSTELGFRLKTINQSQLTIFFSTYITLFIQSKIC